MLRYLKEEGHSEEEGNKAGKKACPMEGMSYGEMEGTWVVCLEKRKVRDNHIVLYNILSGGNGEGNGNPGNR